MRWNKLLCVLVALPLFSFALEFGSMGNRSLGMGGAGVALKQSQWGLYYNPALLAASPAKTFRLGYSFGADIYDRGLFTMYSSIKDGKITNESQVNEALKGNANVSSQNGFVLQILPLGGHNLGIGYFANAFMSFGGYGQVNLNQNVADIDINAAGLAARSVLISEIPIGYAYEINTAFGNISVGGAFKLMFARGLYTQRGLSAEMTNMLNDSIKIDNMASSFNVGLDLGVHYAPSALQNLGFGLVVKNINAPKFKVANASHLRINPQVRFGLAYDPLEWLTIAADVDLTSNTMLPLENSALKSQLIGAGVRLHSQRFENIDIRFGLAKNLRQSNGAIISGGIGLGLIDIALAFSTGSTNINGASFPQYIAVKIGGGISF